MALKGTVHLLFHILAEHTSTLFAFFNLRLWHHQRYQTTWKEMVSAAVNTNRYALQLDRQRPQLPFCPRELALHVLEVTQPALIRRVNDGKLLGNQRQKFHEGTTGVDPPHTTPHARTIMRTPIQTCMPQTNTISRNERPTGRAARLLVARRRKGGSGAELLLVGNARLMHGGTEASYRFHIIRRDDGRELPQGGGGQ